MKPEVSHGWETPVVYADGFIEQQDWRSIERRGFEGNVGHDEAEASASRLEGKGRVFRRGGKAIRAGLMRTQRGIITLLGLVVVRGGDI